MATDFTIRLCGDLDYEEIVADINYCGTPVAIVTQEKGVENMEIEFFNEKTRLIFPLDQLVEAIENAKKELIRYR